MVFQVLIFIFGVYKSAHACLEWFWCHSDTFATQLTRTTRTPEDLVRQVVQTPRFLPGWGQVAAPYLVAIFRKPPNPWKTLKNRLFTLLDFKLCRPPLPFCRNYVFFEKIERQTFFLKKIRTWNAELSSEYPKDGKKDCFRDLFGAYSGKDAKMLK